MNVRFWLSLAVLVAGLGCSDGAADSGTDAGGKGEMGVGGSRTSGSAGSGGTHDPDCEWTGNANANMCKVCAADATCDAPKYTDNKDGTVTSSCCGHVWQQVMDETGGPSGVGTYALDAAEAYCATLKLAGGGWRLPTIEELFSLLVLDQTPPWPTIDRIAFPNTDPVPFWWSSSPSSPSSPYVGPAGAAWGVDFVIGGSGLYDASSTSRVRCVR